MREGLSNTRSISAPSGGPNEQGARDQHVLLIIGRGSIGRKHEQNARALGLSVVTVDPDPRQDADFEQLEDALSAFSAACLPRALIATPVGHHACALQNLLDQGLSSILVEKPLGLPSEIERLEAMASGLTGQQVFLGFNWRFNSAVHTMKQRIQRGDIGQVHVAYLSAREWLPRYQGNVVLESGSHILDTARYLLGELTVVGAQMSNHRRIGESDESASVLLTTDAGGQVLVHVNFINPGPYDYTIQIQGESGVLQDQPDRSEPMHRLMLEAFFRHDTTVLATLEDGIRNLKLLDDVVKLGNGGLVSPMFRLSGEKGVSCCL